jgi:serpin B
VLAAAACGGNQPIVTRSPSPSPTDTPTTTLPPGAIAGIGELRGAASRQPAEAATHEQLQALVTSDTEFALRMYLAMTAGETDDVFLSPYSISTALSMAYGGARANTALQMADALGIDIDAEAWHAARNRLELDMIKRAAEPVKSGERLTLEPTNAIFGQAGFPFEDEYLRVLAAYYGAGMQTVDFASQPEPSRILINDWVADKTHDRIEELLAEGTITELTRAVLVNAIYFYGSWRTPFDPDATSDAPFYLLDGSSVDVPTMHQQIGTTHASGDGWHAVRLPYEGASMLVIVPDTGQFDAVEASLNPDFLADVERQLASADVTLALPRWESATEATLGQLLQQMGMTDAFDPDRADFSGVTPVTDLFISEVVHEANITVDEAGTEAAAATAVVFDVTSAGPPPVTLTVDRPFIYLIEDDTTGEILFIGRLLTP